MDNQTKATVIRGAKRASYDRQQIHGILDSQFLCHLGCIIDGEARVLPTAYVRIGDSLYFHGHRRNRLFEALCDGQTACVTVTCLDGLVLARSAFHHSVNYRSAVVYGQGADVEGKDKVAALDALMEHLVPGRLPHLRSYTEQELAATRVIRFVINEASAKIRTGPPVDSEADYELPIWAGEIPLTTVAGMPIDCPRLGPGVSRPVHIDEFLNNNAGVDNG